MLAKLIGNDLYQMIINSIPYSNLTEIRMRVGRKLVIKDIYKSCILEYKSTKQDIDYIINVATHNSLYAYEDDVKKGFLTFDGIRIGLVGEGVTDNTKLITIKNFTSLIIRIPHQVEGIASSINNLTKYFDNTLIIAPPYAGKTTLIRDICRVLSNKFDTLIIDEREEIYSDKYSFGNNIDVFVGTQKQLITEGIIRACSPEIIVFDEVFPKKDYEIIEQISSSGIKVLASIHGNNFDDIKNCYPTLISLFKNAIVLSNKPRVGSIKSVVRL